MNGDTEMDGRVEVCLNNIYGTVCGINWDELDAKVTCRQLGYSDSSKIIIQHQNLSIMMIFQCLDVVALTGGTYGQGSGPILLGRTVCNGGEAMLVDCASFSSSDCDHSRDAAVQCGGNTCTCISELSIKCMQAAY